MTIGREIEKNILRVLRNAENPVSTRDLAVKIDRAWHSVQHHCFRLQIAGKIHGFQVGRMNLWQLKKEEKNETNGKNHDKEEKDVTLVNEQEKYTQEKD